jgi:alpha-tubulin suppressor-like RCC1 family protein
MPNQFLSDEFGDIEDYFVTDYRLIDNFVGDQLWVWGFGTSGQLGDATTTSKNTPVTTSTGGTTWKSVAAGSKNHSLAIKTDGTLWVWGGNGIFDAKLGINADGNRNTPVTTFAGGNNWKQVAAGYYHSAAIKTDGTLWIWGRNEEYQLGIPLPNPYPQTPVTTFAGGTNWKQVSCGKEHTAAIKTDGSLWTWGTNSDGRLGINNTDLKITPVTTFAGGTDWKSVAAGSNHTAAIKTDGTLWVWGLASSGRLGTNDTTPNRNTPVTTFAGGNNWKQVSAGHVHTGAIKTDGSLWVWGSDDFNVLGRNGGGNQNVPVTTFAGGTNWKQVFAGRQHTAAIKTDGTLWGWGSSSQGQLGINNNDGSNTPVTTFAGGNNWKSVAAGGYHTAAIKSGLNVDLSFFPVGFVTDGLVLHLDAGNTASYPGSGTIWTDLSGNGNNGTLYGSGYNSANGGSITFDGTDDYVGVNNSTSINPTIGITVASFFNVTSFGSSYAPIVFKQNNYAGYFEQYMMYLVNPEIGFSITGVDRNQKIVKSIADYKNQTIYLVGTCDTNTDELKLYVNGTLIQTVAFTSTFDISSTPINIGGSGVLNYGASFNGWTNGKIYSTQIYNRALSATEIQQNFNFFKPRFGL